MMTKQERTFELYYDASQPWQTQALAYAQNLSANVNEHDISKKALTELQLKRLADTLGAPLSELVNINSDLYRDKYKGKELDENDWLITLVHNPEMIKSPIAIYNGKGVICDNISDISKLNVDLNPDDDTQVV